MKKISIVKLCHSPNTACLEYLLCSLILLSKQTIFTNKKKELLFMVHCAPKGCHWQKWQAWPMSVKPLLCRLKKKKKRTRDEKWFAQGHLASKWWCLARLSGPLIPRKLPSHWDKCSYTWGTWQFFRVIQWYWAILSQSWALASQRKEHIF